MSRRGYSLVEMLLVLAIVGVVAAVAAPRYASALANYRLDAAARRIVADLRHAQARAKACSASQTVTFTPDSNKYAIINMADPDKPGSRYVVNLSEAPYLVTLSSASFGGSVSLVFNGYGLPTSGGTVTVVSGSRSRTVLVDAVQGSVTAE